MTTAEPTTATLVRRRANRWPWIAAWLVVAVMMGVGIAGALTIGVFVLPVAFVAAALVGVAQHARTGTGESTLAPPALPGHPREPSVNHPAKLSLVLGIASMVV